MHAACPCPLARIGWLVLAPQTRERLAGLEPEVADKELEDLADLLAPDPPGIPDSLFTTSV